MGKAVMPSLFGDFLKAGLHDIQSGADHPEHAAFRFIASERDGRGSGSSHPQKTLSKSKFYQESKAL